MSFDCWPPFVPLRFNHPPLPVSISGRRLTNSLLAKIPNRLVLVDSRSSREDLLRPSSFDIDPELAALQVSFLHGTHTANVASGEEKSRLRRHGERNGLEV